MTPEIIAIVAVGVALPAVCSARRTSQPTQGRSHRQHRNQDAD